MFSPSRLAQLLAEIEATEKLCMDPKIAANLRRLAEIGLQGIRISIGQRSEGTLAVWSRHEAYPEVAQLAGLELARRAELEA